MNLPAVCSWLLVAALLAAPLPVSSFNLTFLNNAPASHFTERDWELLRGAVNASLEASEDGTAVAWENPETGHLGRVTAVTSSERDGAPCRELEIYNKAKTASGNSRYLFCKQPDGSWKAVAP